MVKLNNYHRKFDLINSINYKLLTNKMIYSRIEIKISICLNCHYGGIHHTLCVMKIFMFAVQFKPISCVS